MKESPLLFHRDDTRLFGVLHRPQGPGERSAFVLSHPFAEEKLWSHRVFVSLARALAERGHPVLRFDYTGSGDSEGATAETSLRTHLADLEAAVAMLAEQDASVDRVGLIGLRLGATFAALMMERAHEATTGTAGLLAGGPLVLWDPVVDGAAYLQEVMRSNLTMQLATHGKVIETREVLQQRILAGGTANVDGYEIGRGLLESCGRTDLLPLTSKRHAAPALVVGISPPGRRRPRPDLEVLSATYARGEFTDAEEQPFWREIRQFYGRADRLQSLTLEWLGRAHG